VRAAAVLVALVPVAAVPAAAVPAAARPVAALPVAARPVEALPAADARDEAVERGGAVADAVAFGCLCSAGLVAGLNVATESIAPATRHTARMLASSGMTVPRAATGPNGLASRFSRFLRRFARSSRR
jgi:hypothetical protein